MRRSNESERGGERERREREREDNEYETMRKSEGQCDQKIETREVWKKETWKEKEIYIVSNYLLTICLLLLKFLSFTLFLLKLEKLESLKQKCGM
jgi:hypothetical protein